MGVPTPDHVIDWKGQSRTATLNAKGKKVFVDEKGEEIKVAHPNARFTAPAAQCPVIASEWEDPAGVPIDAFLFGGRRPTVIPLVNQAKDWTHAVFMGSAAGSETTAANLSAVGVVRRDPMAMLPFFGYNAADYLLHWLTMPLRTDPTKLPKVFFTNWFRKDEKGFMWNGFGDNARVLKWVCERIDGKGKCKDTPIGYLPTADALDMKGYADGSGRTAKEVAAVMEKLTSVDTAGWKQEIATVADSYAQFGNKMPHVLKAKLAEITAALGK